MSLTEITNKILDGMIAVKQDGEVVQMSRREAFIQKLVDDSIFEDDPAARQKAAAMVLSLCGWKDEASANTNKQPAKTGITNKKGEPIGAKNT